MGHSEMSKGMAVYVCLWRPMSLQAWTATSLAVKEMQSADMYVGPTVDKSRAPDIHSFIGHQVLSSGLGNSQSRHHVHA